MGVGEVGGGVRRSYSGDEMGWGGGAGTGGDQEG